VVAGPNWRLQGFSLTTHIQGSEVREPNVYVLVGADFVRLAEGDPRREYGAKDAVLEIAPEAKISPGGTHQYAPFSSLIVPGREP
jgi:hypothetical protein